LFKFQYQAQFDETGAENELCSVFVGKCSGLIRVDSEEISDWRWISPDALQKEMDADEGHTFTPWFKLEWARIWRDHRQAVLVI
jgi:isopentenyl-diphosphate delta-isomerase